MSFPALLVYPTMQQVFSTTHTKARITLLATEFKELYKRFTTVLTVPPRGVVIASRRVTKLDFHHFQVRHFNNVFEQS